MKTAFLTVAILLLAQLSQSQKVGIGNTNPGYILDVSGRMRLRHVDANITSGLWFNKSNNTEGVFTGMINDSTIGFFGNGTVGNWRVGIDVKNAMLGIGNTDPTAPLSFDNNTGDKIDIYHGTPTYRYGIGLQSGLMQLYSGGVGDDIAFGYGSSSSFIERMRVRGNGNVGIGILPTEKFEIRTSSGAIGWKHSWTGGGSLVSTAPTLFTPATIRSAGADVQLTTNTNIGLYVKLDGNVGAGVNNPGRQLDVAGRMRIRGTAGDIYNSAGIYLDGTTDIERSFIGTYSNDMMGLYGAGSGWSLLMNVNDGAISIGTVTAATGYKLNVAGKIIAEEVRVQLTAAWPDYVFANNYQLQPLEQVSAFIKANNHLPGIPAAADVASSGIALGDMQTKMMEKIEELTLYVIQLKSDIDTLKKKN